MKAYVESGLYQFIFWTVIMYQDQKQLREEKLYFSSRFKRDRVLMAGKTWHGDRAVS